MAMKAHLKGLELAYRIGCRRCRTSWSATPTACGRSCSTWWTTPSSSRSAARSSCTCPAGADGDGGPAAVHGDRHRHRRSSGQAAPDLQALRPGRPCGVAALRRDRAGAGRFQLSWCG
ncbi:MAG: hypothetical protein MZV70_46095 [Desulfobacterales bacterium]|nr:hypothetical protein [Desulfobacterales bacterium]